MVYVLLPVSILAAVLLLVPELFGDFAAYQLGLYLIYGIAAQGIGFLWGKTGVLPLGQSLFFGVAAYATGYALREIDSLPSQLILAVIVLAFIALFSFALAVVIFKGRNDNGAYFSLITLALVMIAEQIANTATWLTGGFNGLSGFDSLGGLDPFGNFYYVIVASAVGCSAILLMLNRLPINLVIKGISDNEPRLQLLGFPTHIVKGAAFAFSAVIAALAGGLFASHQGIVTPTSSGFALATEMVILAAVGGRFHVLGPLIGAVVVGWASAELRDSFPYWEIVIAAIFIAVVLKAPGGIAELIDSLFKKFSLKQRAPTSDPIEAPQPRHSCESRALSFHNVKLKIGVVEILNGISFETPKSGVVSVIGPNGAGKTSALNTVTGNLKVTGGQIWFGGDRIENRAPHQALQSGIGRKMQVPSVFFSMTVQENLAISMMAGRAKWLDFFSRNTIYWRSKTLQSVLAHPSVPLLQELDKEVGALPQGHRQFLEFAMTAAAEPALMLLDEPCAGLSPNETSTMTNLVREFQAETGGLVVMIEHDMSIVEAISDKVLVLHQGKDLAFDSYDVVSSDPAVQKVYAGGTK